MLNMKIAAAVRGQHLFAEEIVELRLAVSREAHHLPFVAGKHIEADIVRHGRIELAEAVRQFDAFQDLDLVALALAKKRRRIFAGAVPRQVSRPNRTAKQKTRDAACV